MYDELTEQDIKKMEEEIEYRKVKLAPELGAELKRTREFGDLSENSEYDEARNEQAKVEARIKELEELLLGAVIVDESKIDTSKALLLSTVKIKNLKTNAIMAYTLVPEKEADLKNHKISVTSPIAKGLLGKSVGDQVEIQVPAGKVMFEIIEITR